MKAICGFVFGLCAVVLIAFGVTLGADSVRSKECKHSYGKWSGPALNKDAWTQTTIQIRYCTSCNVAQARNIFE